jgi:TPR repeat protein
MPSATHPGTAPPRAAAVPIAPPPPPAGRPAPALAKLPLVLIAALGACLLLPRVRGNPHLFGAFAGVTAALLVWQVVLWGLARRAGRRLLVDYVPPVRQHYIQACVQLCLYAYWGYWWVQPDGVRPIYAQVPLVLAQAVFLYAFDALFAWSRGRTWRLASGPLPIVLSTNLFIWFRDDWFVWQFAMIVAGLLGKEFVKWQKEGRRTHVFNPSGFGLAVAATVLIATDAVDLTWAKPLATTIENPPQIFLFLFCLGLVVQHFFAVTLMTFAAAVTMVAINHGYMQATGVYLFASTNLPAAAFLGLHLLMTDPSTSPRSNLGRAIFGAGYGLGYVVVFQLLGAIGAPELFAKLYPVPILNLCVQRLDALARTGWTGRLNRRWEAALRPRAMNALHMALWATVFLALWGTGYVGGRDHPGDSIAFWKQAVVDGKPEAARKLVMVAGSQAIGRGSAAAFNELGILTIAGEIERADTRVQLKSAAHWWAEAAERGSLEACENLVATYLFLGAYRSDQELAAANQVVQRAAQQGRARSCFLLGFAHEAGQGLPPDAVRALALYRAAGTGELPAQKGIARLALRPAGAGIDLAGIAPALERAATAGDGESAWLLAHLHATGRGVPRDDAQVAAWRERAVALGWPPAVAAASAAALAPFAPPERRLLAPPWSTAFPG